MGHFDRPDFRAGHTLRVSRKMDFQDTWSEKSDLNGPDFRPKIGKIADFVVYSVPRRRVCKFLIYFG